MEVAMAEELVAERLWLKKLIPSCCTNSSSVTQNRLRYALFAVSKEKWEASGIITALGVVEELKISPNSILERGSSMRFFIFISVYFIVRFRQVCTKISLK